MKMKIFLTITLLTSFLASAKNLVFPSINGKIKNSAKIDLKKLKIFIKYESDPGENKILNVALNHITGQYTVPGYTFSYGSRKYVEGTYLDFHILAQYDGQWIANMSDIHVYTWERRGYDLLSFLEIYKNGASSLEVFIHQSSGQLVLSGNISKK